MTSPFQQIKSFAQRKNLPLIPVKAKDVATISEPNHFYHTIIDKIITSTERLSLTALYIGTGPKENEIIKAICEQKEAKRHLKVRFILDASRATRSDPLGQSSVTILNRLLKYDNVNLNLFSRGNSSSYLGRLLSRYQRWNELTTTFHTKLLVFDDDVLVTGANLSNLYFDKRQDRYILFRNSNYLSCYFDNLLEKIVDNNINLETCVLKHNKNFIVKWKDDLNKESDTYVIPLTQFGKLGLTDKEDFLKFLDSILPENGKSHLSTGYFNPSPVIDKLRITSILGPSEKANGFYNGHGFLKYIPRIYSALARRYLRNHPTCELYEYDRSGWSHHAKGIWYEGFEGVYVHVVGSSNFNYRSSQRDFETQLVLLTSDKNLIERLEEERSRLWSESSRLTSNKLKDLNFLYDFMSKLLRTYL